MKNDTIFPAAGIPHQGTTGRAGIATATAGTSVFLVCGCDCVRLGFDTQLEALDIQQDVLSTV